MLIHLSHTTSWANAEMAIIDSSSNECTKLMAIPLITMIQVVAHARKFTIHSRMTTSIFVFIEYLEFSNKKKLQATRYIHRYS